MHLEKNREKQLVGNRPNQKINDLLAETEKAIREGNSRQAYELTLQATKLAPENPHAWFLRATLAPSLEERVFCVNCLNELTPHRRDRHNVGFFALKDLLDKDPFLAYLEETEALYRVINKNNLVVVIPKKRAAFDPQSREGPSPMKAAYRLLMLAILGLLLAGIGTLIFAPLAALAALRAGPSLPSRSAWVHSMVVVILSLLLFMIGSFFGALFVLHLTG